MRLYPVGPKPIVNQRGVNFDNTHPDRYPFLSPAIELLETLDFNAEQEEVHLHEPRKTPYTGHELEEKVREYCGGDVYHSQRGVARSPPFFALFRFQYLDSSSL